MSLILLQNTISLWSFFLFSANLVSKPIEATQPSLDILGREQRGEFHVSHDASLHTILSSLRLHVILSVLISSTGTRQFNNGGKRLVLPIKPSVPLLCLSFYDFRSTIPNISLVNSKRVFGRRLLVNYCN